MDGYPLCGSGEGMVTSDMDKGENEVRSLILSQGFL